ncbi:serine phosphatase RsbU (regulator of sigma subunit) [Streptomyces sp. CEV 2-1]|uniref:PP2C family protein-serine/threonine phosphatase n=2 Tax=unclassified Streptomyces TaxID=2593676 RepID=UPI000F47E647|nr:GAF domain-containing SpoIIE family protein phosphatase [Streptomyces sp. CEV 2-1]ROQ81154.1 serine phosphatase RsbU (regulator of sigma subunit) [Streptomyces sp. CEV 2-1]
MEQHGNGASPQADDGWWSGHLHELWRVAETAPDVTGLADSLYGMLLRMPGVLAVVGTRWTGGLLHDLRSVTLAEPTPSFMKFEQDFGESGASGAPDGDPAVTVHEVSELDGAMPQVQVLTAAGARSVAECAVPLGQGGWASFMVGTADRDAVDATLRTRLKQVAEVAMVSDRRIMARRDAELLQVSDAFLAEASLQMDASLDVERTVRRVARTAVPAVAEGCVLHLLHAGGLTPVSSAHMDAGEQQWLGRVAAEDPWLTDVLHRVIDSGQGLVLRSEELEGGPFGPASSGAGRAVSALSVNPLKARGRALGTLTFLYHQAFAAEEASRFLANLADRAALAIDSSALYEQRRRHVVSLQRHLLPRELPRIAGLTLSSAYEVGDVSLDVGGDFYDAVPGAQGGVTLLIGDVCGRGAEAAALTGLARHTLRTLLEDGRTPEHALGRLNQALVREGTSRFVTALVAVLVPDGKGFRLCYWSAGHPAPLIRREDGTVEELPAHGDLLGVLEDIGYGSGATHVAPGDTLVMFTDGVTEARAADGTFFESRLRNAVAQTGAGEALGFAERLAEAVVEFRATGADDIAVLAARVEVIG